MTTATLDYEAVETATTRRLAASPIDAVSDERGREPSRAKWQDILIRIKGWVQNPATLVNNGHEPVAEEAVSLAIQYAILAMNDQADPPDWCVPSTDGGVSLQWVRQGCRHEVEFRADGGVEETRVSNGRVLSHLVRFRESR